MEPLGDYLMTKILLGYEIGTGNEVHMENHHTVVTGMTQLSGKTTTLEALVHRGKVKAIAFLTKRGEGGFRGQREIPAYFKEQRKGRLIDWQYVEAILEATMGERMKFERSWIIKVCKGAGSLEEVYQNIITEQKTARGLHESIYTNLGAYFEIILPEISKYQFADKIKLSKGFNVMNLIGVSDEMQQLIIESTLSYVLQKERDTVVIIPEAHKFVPQGKKTPVKATALRLIREGAAINNYLWIDTQETTSVDKAVLKQCSNWIMGYQQERNEVANVRENIGRRKIKEEDIMTLKIGHFIASLQQEIHHVYVLPASLEKNIGKLVAMGEMTVREVKDGLAMRDKETIRLTPKQNVSLETKEIRSGFTKDQEKVEDYLRSEKERDLTRKLETLQEEFGEYKESTENQERVYRESIDGLQEQDKKLTGELSKSTLRADLLMEKLVRYEVFEDALSTFLKPLIPESSVKVDEKTLERLIDKKINALLAKRRRKIEPEGETGMPWVDMWLPKLKKPVERKIVRLLAEKLGVSLTKDQIALATGYTVTGGTFNGAMSTLKNKYKLIKQDGDKYSIMESPP